MHKTLKMEDTIMLRIQNEIIRIIALLVLSCFAGIFAAVYQPNTTYNAIYMGLLFVPCIVMAVCGAVIWSASRKIHDLKNKKKGGLIDNSLLIQNMRNKAYR